MEKYEKLESLALDKELKPMYESCMPQEMYRQRIGGGGGGSGPYRNEIGGGGGGSGA